jgi:hypothetical protein
MANRTLLDDKRREVLKRDAPHQYVEVLDPIVHENPRMVAQQGVFVRFRTYEDLEGWVRQNFKGVKDPVLIRSTISEDDRAQALRSLNRMNVNYMTLFPDLEGAALFSNHAMTIENYAFLPEEDTDGEG